MAEQVVTEQVVTAQGPLGRERLYGDVLDQDRYEHDGYAIVPLRRRDIYDIKRWRNDQIDILRQQEPLTDDGQRRYYDEVVSVDGRSKRPRQILFSFLEGRDRCIGYGGLTNIDWVARRAELAFLLANDRNADVDRFKGDFRRFLGLVTTVCFDSLGLNRLFAETFDIRPYVIEVLEELGFRAEGRMREHVMIAGRPVDSLLHGLVRRDHTDRSRATVVSSGASTTPEFGNVLVTSIGAKVPMIEAVKAAIRDLDPDAKVIGGDVDPDAIGRHLVDEFWPMPPTAELGLADIVDHCRDHRITAIIPSRDGELTFWATHRAELREAGIRVMVSRLDAIATCLDKLTFSRRLIDVGLPAIPTVLDPEEVDAPVVVKERFGAGSRRVRLDCDRPEARRYATRLESPVFQPRIRGREFSVDAYVDDRGRFKGAVARVRELVVDGESQVTTTVDHHGLHTLAEAVARALGLSGHVMIQVIEDPDGGLHIIECNARFGGASTLALATGLDSFRWFLLEAAGVDVGDHGFERVSTELTQVRVAADIVSPSH